VNLSIREAVAADADAVASVRVAAAEDLTARFGKGLWSSTATDKGVLFAMMRGRVMVAMEDGAIIGTLTLSTRKPWAIDPAYFTKVRTPIYLTSMAIEPAMQGKGVGRALLADAEERARQWRNPGPGQSIRLDAFDAVAGAGGFYAKCGYTERGRVVFRTAPLIYFERLLAAP
jgi:GNAT superfamily N-acetyltransferase